MARKGWILLWHKLADDPLWLEEPFTRGQAWVDLLLMASTPDAGDPGIVRCSKLFLMRRWHWSHCKLDRFLRHLQQNSMIISHQISHRNSQSSEPLLSIVKYESYQNPRKADSQQKSEQNSHKNSSKNSYIERRTEDFCPTLGGGKNERLVPVKFRDMFRTYDEYEAWRRKNS